MSSNLSSSEANEKLESFFVRGAAVKGLCESCMTGAPVHASLITGPAGVGKRVLAALCAKALHCTGSDRPCGRCPACARFSAGSHPDALYIPEKKRIGVDEIRDLIGKLSVASYEGGWKTVRVDSAGSMTAQAQNSLLKTLEEPPPRTVFFLAAVSVREMLPTIISRCRVTPLFPLTQDVIFQALSSNGAPEDKARIASMACGSMDEASRMLTDEDFWSLWNRVSRAMESVRAPADAFEAIDVLKEEKENAKRVLDILELELREALYRKINKFDIGSGWIGTLQKAGANTIVTLQEKIFTLRAMLQSNVSWQSALERFVLDYSEGLL